jgi:crotonobetainyl-CoA:carnitine CoA-transferase CaiB-like acyl-CoA transferase
MNVVGILAALFHKQRTGEGQKVEANLLSTAISLQCQEAFAVMNLGQRFERSEAGIGAPWAGAPYGVYATKDGYMAIAMAPVPLIGEILGLPELVKYENPMDAFRYRDEIKEQIEEKTVEKSTDEWLKIMGEHDIWCGPVNTLADVFDDPQVDHNEIVRTMQHPKAGQIRTIGFPVSLSKTPATYRTPPPLVGEHNTEILRSLGYSESDIDGFAQSGLTEQKKPE